MLALLAAAETSVAAPPAPGEEIGRANAESAADWVSPGVLWLLRHGMRIRIAPYRPTGFPPAYQAATEKFSSQVKLRSDGTLDESTYVAGLPFPLLDPSDPEIAVKILYDWQRSRYFTDDFEASLSGGSSGAIEATDRGLDYHPDTHFVVGAHRALRYVGRTVHEPLPALPNPLGLLEKRGRYPFLEPYDLSGVGGLFHRYLDGRPDDTWVYLPTFRRARRIPSVDRSSPLPNQDVDVDSDFGLDVQVASFAWRLLAIRPMLSALSRDDAASAACDDSRLTLCTSWELRPKVYVVEGTPKTPGYAYSKRVVFLDGEGFSVLYSDLYDRSGELWKIAANHLRHAPRPNPAGAIEYPFPRDFIAESLLVDVRRNRATRVRYPAGSLRGESGWCIDCGTEAVGGEDWFTAAAMIAAGR